MKGLKVIGVNGFDDKKEEVKKIMDEDKIAHQILLGGSDVAVNQYFAIAFPTTFWIDRNGKIFKRTTGFRKENAPAMRQEIQELLKD